MFRACVVSERKAIATAEGISSNGKDVDGLTRHIRAIREVSERIRIFVSARYLGGGISCRP